MGSESKHTIEQNAIRIFARGGYDALSMRELATQSSVSLSSIYHFFADKDVLLRHLFEQVNRSLGVERANLPARKSAHRMLVDRIGFQFDHIESVVFVLKYYMHYRDEFKENTMGFLPPKAHLHIEEVLLKGLETGEYQSLEIDRDAKIVAHAINGFLLEYYPVVPHTRQRRQIVMDIAEFVDRALRAERRDMTQ